MSQRTGNPRGRPQGAKNKRTEAVQAAAQQAAEQIEGSLPDAFKGDAHAYLMAIYKDPNQQPQLRIDAAKAAIRYEKPALASAEGVKVKDDEVPLSERLKAYAQDEAIESSAGKVVALKR